MSSEEDDDESDSNDENEIGGAPSDDGFVKPEGLSTFYDPGKLIRKYILSVEMVNSVENRVPKCLFSIVPKRGEGELIGRPCLMNIFSHMQDPDTPCIKSDLSEYFHKMKSLEEGDSSSRTPT